MIQIARALLETGAVHIKPNEEDYFTWTSGKRSPIYCDNRQLISYPLFRKDIVRGFCTLIREEFNTVQVIAGTATAGIPWAAWIADELDLPMIYIRSKPKAHGMGTAIEGHFSENENVLVIEDLISTGKSSCEAYEHVRQAGLNTLAILSIFTYQFEESAKKFAEHGLVSKSLCTLDNLLDYSQQTQLISGEQCEQVKTWRKSQN